MNKKKFRDYLLNFPKKDLQFNTLYFPEGNKVVFGDKGFLYIKSFSSFFQDKQGRQVNFSWWDTVLFNRFYHRIRNEKLDYKERELIEEILS